MPHGATKKKKKSVHKKNYKQHVCILLCQLYPNKIDIMYQVSHIFKKFGTIYKGIMPPSRAMINCKRSHKKNSRFITHLSSNVNCIFIISRGYRCALSCSLIDIFSFHGKHRKHRRLFQQLLRKASYSKIVFIAVLGGIIVKCQNRSSYNPVELLSLQKLLSIISDSSDLVSFINQILSESASLLVPLHYSCL